MALKPENIADLRLKHLEMVQGIVSRMAGYGASYKGFCITVVTAVGGYALALKSPLAATLAFLPLLAFAAVDALYLRTERRFRLLYGQIRSEAWRKMPTFDVSLEKAPAASFWSAFFSWSIFGFYAPLGMGVVIAIIGIGWVG